MSSEELDFNINDPVPLQNRWRLFFEKPGAGNWVINDDTLQTICTISTVQEFWGCFNSVPSVGTPSSLAIKTSFHLMKYVNEQSVRPAWEDPENSNGGEWTFRVQKSDADNVWQALLLAVIGEQFAECLSEGDDICGVSVSGRSTDTVIQLWNKSVLGNYQAILNRLQELLPGIEIRSPFYKLHKEKSEQSRAFNLAITTGSTTPGSGAGSAQTSPFPTATSPSLSPPPKLGEPPK